MSRVVGVFVRSILAGHRFLLVAATVLVGVEASGVAAVPSAPFRWLGLTSAGVLMLVSDIARQRDEIARRLSTASDNDLGGAREDLIGPIAGPALCVAVALALGGLIAALLLDGTGVSPEVRMT